jgi:hypothetical protein
MERTARRGKSKKEEGYRIEDIGKMSGRRV